MQRSFAAYLSGFDHDSSASPPQAEMLREMPEAEIPM